MPAHKKQRAGYFPPFLFTPNLFSYQLSAISLQLPSLLLLLLLPEFPYATLTAHL